MDWPFTAMERIVQFEWLKESIGDEQIVGGLYPATREWWRSKFNTLSLPQRLAIPAIAAAKNVLVCAPTGTGKTLCAFISILSDLLERHAAGTLTDAIDTVYISPLKALGADITRNLLQPLAEMTGTIPGQASAATAVEPAVRIAQRTGDTTPSQRARLIKCPPHILITTPETLALCLAGEKMRHHLRAVRRIIVDELHSLAPNKRGTDLMLSVERLSHWVMRHGGADPQRIGLSATIAPLDGMAAYLVGSPEAQRSCAIADASFDRPLELEVASVFGRTPFLTTAAINRSVYDLFEQTIRTHRTTLVFTNTRAATERVTFALRKRFAAALEKGEECTEAMIHPQQIQAHHSSLDRDQRLEIERRLKAGELRAVICSTSLELGIDIGTIDRVVLLNNPRGVARGLQRIGRSGHSLDGIARGTFVPTLPTDLLEALVTADAMRRRAIDRISYPRGCLDVLAQQLTGMVLQATPGGIHVDDAFAIVRHTTSFADLPREQFDEVIRFVATDAQDNGASSAKLYLDESGHLHPRSKGVRGLYAQNVGTITQEGQVKVRLKDAAVIGTVEEAFAQYLKTGDRFILGGRCVMVAGSKGMTVEVIECAGQTPTVPRWHSGMMSMEPGLAARMREFRARVRAIAPAGQSAIARLLVRQYAAPGDAAHVASIYLHAQHRYAEIPIEGHLLVERVPDDGGPDGQPASVLVFHTMIGRAANDALARVVAYRLHKRFGGVPLKSGPVVARTAIGGASVVVDDYAFGVWVASSSAARRADRTLVRSILSPAGFDEDLTAALETSDLFRTQFRFTALRAHALLQNKFGRRRFIGQMTSYATRLLETLREHDPRHLLIRETRRTILDDILAAPLARQFLDQLPAQNLRLLDLPAPSPFAFSLFATSRRDTLQLADTADFLLAMYQHVQQRLASQEEPRQAELFS